MPPFDPLRRRSRGHAEASSGVCGALCSHLLAEVLEVTTHTISDHNLAAPCVSLLLVGSHPTAAAYASSTVAAAESCGVDLRVIELPGTASDAEVRSIIARSNADRQCHGIVLQLPLPAHLDAHALLETIADDKDVDMLKDNSVRRCLMRSETSVGVGPCIASAVEEVLRSLDVLRTPGRRGPPPPPPQVVLLGVPPLLAFPLEVCLDAAGCRVSCLDHEAAESARAALRRTDVLLIGAPRPDVVAAQWVRSGCTILDLGLGLCQAPSRVHSVLRTNSNASSSDGETGETEEPPSPQQQQEQPQQPQQPQQQQQLPPQPPQQPPQPQQSSKEAEPPATAPPATQASQDEATEQRDVLCLCCSDGLTAVAAALRMRNASHAALVQQGFLDIEKPCALQMVGAETPSGGGLAPGGVYNSFDSGPPMPPGRAPPSHAHQEHDWLVQPSDAMGSPAEWMAP